MVWLQPGLGWWWWRVSLGRGLTRGDSQTESSAPSRGLAEADAVGGSLAGTARLTAGKDATLMWRDPMRRLPWLLSAFMTIGWTLLVLPNQAAPLGCALGALLFGAQAANMYAYEGSGLWLHVVAFGDRIRARGEVLGHLVVVLVSGVPFLLIGIGVVAAIRDGWALVPAAIGVCLAAIAGSAATGCLLSAYSPYAMPQSRKSMFASSVPGQKGQTMRATLGTLIGGIVAALPAGLAALFAVRGNEFAGWLALLVGLVTVPIVTLIAVRGTAERYLATAPQILATVMAGDRV